MRRVANVDANQPQIVKDLRSAGMTVQCLHAVGSGCPDLLVGWRGSNTLLEVKDGDKALSRQALTADETSWHESWGGQVTVVRNSREAIEAVIANCEKGGR